MQHILVTGGAGGLGRLIVAQLSAAGYTVRGMSRRARPGDDWPGAQWAQADLETGAGLTELVTPTNGALMAVLLAAGVPFERWIRFVAGGVVIATAIGIAAIATVMWFGL